MKDLFTKTFGSSFAGQVLDPTDAAYTQASTGWALKDQHSPALVLMAQNINDMRLALQFARENQLPFAVHNTGHGKVKANQGGVLLNTSGLTGIHIDSDAQTATIEAGVTWAQLLETARPYGLTGLTGDTPSVGVVSYTLGGGFGWLARQYGLGCDALLELSLLKANGDVCLVNPQSDPELFWALRGGGGGFGLVTSMTLQLYPLAQAMCAQVVFALEDAKQAWHLYRDWLNELPNAMTSRVMLIHGPDVEEMPPFLRNQTRMILQCCHSDDLEQGHKLLEPLLKIPNAIAQLVEAVAPADFGRFFGSPPAPVKAYGRAEHLDQITDEVIDDLLGFASTTPCPPFLLEIRHAGGAVANVPSHASAFAHRNTSFVVNFHALAFVPVLDMPCEQMTQGLTKLLEPHANGAIMPNFINGDEGLPRDQAAYPETQRSLLKALKQKLDFENLFALTRTAPERLA